VQALWSDSCGTLHKADERVDQVRSSGTFRAEDRQQQTEKEKKAAVHGMIEMLTQNARPGVGRGQGLPGTGRGGPVKSGVSHVTGMPVKGKQIGPDMIQPVRDKGGCIGYDNDKLMVRRIHRRVLLSLRGRGLRP
jgi:hypothetical protein